MMTSNHGKEGDDHARKAEDEAKKAQASYRKQAEEKEKEATILAGAAIAAGRKADKL